MRVLGIILSFFLILILWSCSREVDCVTCRRALGADSVDLRLCGSRIAEQPYYESLGYTCAKD